MAQPRGNDHHPGEGKERGNVASSGQVLMGFLDYSAGSSVWVPRGGLSTWKVNGTYRSLLHLFPLRVGHSGKNLR